jgi:hypothetical protein
MGGFILRLPHAATITIVVAGRTSGGFFQGKRSMLFVESYVIS